MIIKGLIRILLTALALLAIARYVDGITVPSFYVAVIVALVWGLVILVVRPVLSILTLPINLLSFGLFSFVLNALLFWLVSIMVPGFSVAGFIPALEGSVLLTVLGWALHSIF